jgi:hypothetical protein
MGNDKDYKELQARLQKTRSPFAEMEKIGLKTAGVSPSVINRLYPKMPGGKAEGDYAHRNVRSAKELDDIVARGAALPPEGSTNPQKYWTQTSSPNLSTKDSAAATIRAKVSNIKENEPVKREHIERYNPDTGEFEPFKKGGKVKVTASSRADGIAKRGKTRGRMV